MSAMERNAEWLQMADSRSSSDSTERPLSDAYLPPRRERRLQVVEPPAGASAPMGAIDPLLPMALPDSGHSARCLASSLDNNCLRDSTIRICAANSR